MDDSLSDLNLNASPILYKLFLWAASDLSYFANDNERWKLITVGAACGFVASFGAPIGGMLLMLAMGMKLVVLLLATTYRRVRSRKSDNQHLRSLTSHVVHMDRTLRQ